MLTEEEKQFIRYWEANRLKRKKVFRQLALGLPLATVLVVAIFVNFYSGWDKRVDMVRDKSQDASLLLVLGVAALFIIVFIVIFSVRHKWDMHEQRYRELLSQQKNPDSMHP
jgi:hypothetical protein